MRSKPASACTAGTRQQPLHAAAAASHRPAGKERQVVPRCGETEGRGHGRRLDHRLCTVVPRRYFPQGSWTGEGQHVRGRKEEGGQEERREARRTQRGSMRACPFMYLLACSKTDNEATDSASGDATSRHRPSGCSPLFLSRQLMHPHLSAPASPIFQHAGGREAAEGPEERHIPCTRGRESLRLLPLPYPWRQSETLYDQRER